MGLTFEPKVVTSASIERTVSRLSPFFKNEPSTVTSGVRIPQDQLRIITNLAKDLKIQDLFEEFGRMRENSISDTIEIGGEKLFWWQRTWAKELEMGMVVNPPMAAEALYDYIVTVDGVKINKKGRIIGVSPHFKGTAFDIGAKERIDEKTAIIVEAIKSGKCFIKGYRKEHGNGCVHVDCVPLIA